MEDEGKVNRYMCRLCGQATYTINRACGVTPFAIACPLCGTGSAESCFYRCPQNSLATHEWFRPTRAEFEALNVADVAAAVKIPADIREEIVRDGNHEHLANGGLFLRKIERRGA